MEYLFAVVLGVATLFQAECHASDNNQKEQGPASNQTSVTDIDDLLLVDLESISEMTVSLSSKK